jgi:sugar phosphate isomerase/epimerase
MKLRENPPLHLTYCLNVHPGETWEENFEAVRGKALAVKRLVAPGKPFGLGLRLGRAAAQTLGRPAKLREFRRFLGRNGLYVFTVNGFPYGGFHRRSVKHDVYRPDWRSTRRRDYTVLLADLLARLLPRGLSGSISTVPLSHKSRVKGDADVRGMTRMLATCAAHLARIRRRTGKDICLALEPEPDCFIENTDETLRFFSGALMEFGAPVVAGEMHVPARDAEAILRRHVGVCLDVCHFAVAFEDPAKSLKKLAEAGVRVAKVQLSSALRLRPTALALRRLREFCDSVYLHQVKVRTSRGEVISCDDLPAALAGRAAMRRRDDEWRVHFHVPLFVSKYGELRSTGSLYTRRLARLLTGGVTEHLEIETYTFDVLPEALRSDDVVQSIAREYDWTLRRLKGEAPAVGDSRTCACHGPDASGQRHALGRKSAGEQGG